MRPANGVSPARRLIRFLQSHKGKLKSLLILTHDHPDPDALATAWALSHLVHAYSGARSRIAYGGMLGRRENLVMVESLDLPAHRLRPNDLNCAHAALVDTQPPFKNNRFNPLRHPDLIVDHHPRHPRTGADLALIDPSVGATTTILAEALIESGLKVSRRLATAIIYGIGSETQNLGREAGPRDRAAYLAFLPQADMQALWRIANPPRPASFFQTLARGIRNAFVCRNVIGVHLHEIFSPDRVAQVADFLLTHEKMAWSVVTGRYHGRLYVSLRSRNLSVHAGRLLRSILGGGNRGGGHRMIAGGSVEVGHGVPEERWRALEERTVSAFLKRIGVSGQRRHHPFRSGT